MLYGLILLELFHERQGSLHKHDFDIGSTLVPVLKMNPELCFRYGACSGTYELVLLCGMAKSETQCYSTWTGFQNSRCLLLSIYIQAQCDIIQRPGKPHRLVIHSHWRLPR